VSLLCVEKISGFVEGGRGRPLEVRVLDVVEERSEESFDVKASVVEEDISFLAVLGLRIP
jgi:hypothetical protein